MAADAADGVAEIASGGWRNCCAHWSCRRRSRYCGCPPPPPPPPPPRRGGESAGPGCGCASISPRHNIIDRLITVVVVYEIRDQQLLTKGVKHKHSSCTHLFFEVKSTFRKMYVKQLYNSFSCHEIAVKTMFIWQIYKNNTNTIPPKHYYYYNILNYYIFCCCLVQNFNEIGFITSANSTTDNKTNRWPRYRFYNNRDST